MNGGYRERKVAEERADPESSRGWPELARKTFLLHRSPGVPSNVDLRG